MNKWIASERLTPEPLTEDWRPYRSTVFQTLLPCSAAESGSLIRLATISGIMLELSGGRCWTTMKAQTVSRPLARRTFRYSSDRLRKHRSRTLAPGAFLRQDGRERSFQEVRSTYCSRTWAAVPEVTPRSLSQRKRFRFVSGLSEEKCSGELFEDFAFIHQYMRATA